MKINVSSHSVLPKRLLFTVLLLAMTAFAVYLFWAMLQGFRSQTEQFGWDATPCRVTAGDIAVAAGDRPFTLKLTYRYRYGDDTYTHEVDAGHYDDYTEAWLDQRDNITGDEVSCYVNPQDPAEFVRRLPHSLRWLWLLLPLTLFAVMLGFLYLLWAGAGGEKGRSRSLSQRAAGRVSGREGLGCGLIFFSLFALTGAGVGVMMWRDTGLDGFTSYGWRERPAEVIYSRLQSQTSDGDTTYRPDIFYRYDWAGEEYRSNRYDVIGGFSGHRAGAQRVVDAHPSGASVTAYVNPRAPWKAVLKPGLTWSFLLWLVPVMFLTVGLGGMALVLKASSGVGRPAAPSDQTRRRASRQLDPARLGRVWLLLVFTLAFSGATAALLTADDKGFGLWVMLTVFALVSLLLFAGLVQAVLALFNPKVRLTLPAGGIRAGEPFSLAWRTDGRRGTVAELRFVLEGEESVTYRTRHEGKTTTRSARSAFAPVELTRCDDAGNILSGRAQVSVPRGLIPSFEAPHNRVGWTLVVHGVVRRWPDIEDRHSVTLLPAGGTER